MTPTQNILIPDYEEKQRLLYSDKIAPELIERSATLCFEAGAFNDAMDLFARLNHTAGIEKIAQAALNEGNLFLFDRAMLMLKRPMTPEIYNQIGDKAYALGKIAYARQAFEKAGNTAMVEKCNA